jgi:hypothetical protein
LDNSDDEANYDLAIIPPPPSILTDEEEGADDDLNITSLPRDIPGNIEVFTYNAHVSDDDSSDDEPLAAKRLRRHQQEGIPTWRKCHPMYTSIMETNSEVVQKKRLL